MSMLPKSSRPEALVAVTLTLVAASSVNLLIYCVMGLV